MRPAHRALSRRCRPTPSGRPARRSLCYSCLSSIPGLMLPSGRPGSASPAFTARSMQPTVKERHLSDGLSAQHETTYFAGTGATQAIEQPAPVLSVCAGRGDPRLALSKLHHLAWSRRPSCIELRRSRTASRMRRFCSALDYCARMELYPGVFVSSLSAEVWEP